MNLLCFDVSSGGVSAALFDERLHLVRITESPWSLEAGGAAAAPSIDDIVDVFAASIRALDLTRSDSVEAVCIGTFLHSCILLDRSDRPLTQVSTWLDESGEAGMDFIRSHLKSRFHEITGCRYHPMFPVFKIAAMRRESPEALDRAGRLVSVKALLLHRLTSAWIEDHGTASASGFFNVTQANWDAEILELAGLKSEHLGLVVDRTSLAGRVTPEAAAEFGLPEGIPAVVGSGDGFLANIGSQCEEAQKAAVTLGTSAVVRQTLDRPVFSSSAGTFCYRADARVYLLGCAGSNGGNVLDWGRRLFGAAGAEPPSLEPPIFVPLLHGERSPDWDPHLTGSWRGLEARHTAADLLRSILEGVIFNLAHYVDIVQQTSGQEATDLVLSGNGFLETPAAPILAAVTGLPTWRPASPGLASLRGAAVCALRALGLPEPALELKRVQPLAGADKIQTRYREYRMFRAGAHNSCE